MTIEQVQRWITSFRKIKKLMRRSVRELAQEYDDEYWREIRREERFAEDIYSDLADGGWTRIPYPEEYGGEGLGVLDLVIVMEALGEEGAWEAAGVLGLLSYTFGGLPIVAHGTDRQKKAYLPGIIEGRDLWSIAVTEADTGLNTANISTFAERGGDGFRINGEKQFISGIEHAHRILVIARTTPRAEASGRFGGVTMFIVDPEDPAVEHEPIPLNLYFRDQTHQVYFDDLYVDKDQVLGTLDDGVYEMFEILDVERITGAAEGYGMGRWALDMAVDQAKSRVVWDEPIGAHQAIQHPLADSYADLINARELVRKAAWQYDNGSENLGEISNIANLQMGKAAWNAAESAMTTFGGMSATSDLGIAAVWGAVRHYRTAPVSEEMIRNYIGQHSLRLPRSYST